MNKKNHTRSALFTSIISLLLCVSMLAGTTFAWFTDNVTSANNIIRSGNLDVTLEYWDGNSWEDVEAASDILAGDLWEPGYVDVAYLRLKNAGSLALKYQLGVNIVSETEGKNQKEEAFKLSDYIYFDVVEGVNGETGAYANRAAALAVATENTKISAGYSKSGALKAGSDYAYLAMVVYMPTTVGNVANHNGVNVPQIDLGINVFATQFTSESDSFDENYDGGAKWIDDASIGWYQEGLETGEYVIGSAEDLAGLAAIVNGTATSETATYSARTTTIQDDFAGKTITLASNIDLAGKAWTPIGNWDNTFRGNFDGQGYTINNLYINAPEGEGVGLFGVVQKATIKDINVKNVKIFGYSMVAGIVGAAYPANISDCKITGNVEIGADWAYVAGVAGYCYYGTQVDGCSVIAEGTGLIQSNTRNAVGGITAWLLEGDHKVTDCHVKNLNLVGWTNVGGITGFVHYNNTIDGCSVENVKLTKTRMDGNPGIGLIAGGWSYHASNAITLRNNTVKNATMEGNHVAYAAYNELYGSEYGGATTTNFVLENNSTENITNKLVEVVAVKDAEGLKTALANGGNNYVLTADIALTETLTVSNGVEVAIDLGGKTISGTLSGTGNQDLFLVKGNLTVNNGSIELTATQNQGWGAMSTIFDITAGGIVNLDNVVADNKGGTDMNFVAHLNNWGTATLNVESSTLKAGYIPVRVFNSGNDMNNVTIENSTLAGKYCFWVHNYTLADFGTAEKVEAHKALLDFDIYGNGNSFENTGKAPVLYGFTDSLYFTAEGTQIVEEVADLDKMLLEGKDVALSENVTIDTSKTSANSGYGATGVKVAGGTLDGNGYSLGVNAWNTWDCAVNTTGGTIKNLTINSGMRGIFMGGASADVYIDNVTIDGTVYTFNSDAGNKNYGVYISNSTLNGWTSFSDAHKEVVFTNCNFGEGQGYAFCRPYNTTAFVSCDFEAGFEVDPVAAVTFENCTFAGEPLTAENLATLVTNAANASIK